MRFLLIIALAASSGLDAVALSLSQGARASRSATRPVVSTITVTVPQEDSELSLDGQPVPGTGSARRLTTPGLAAGKTQRYTLAVTWRPNTYTTMTRSRVITVAAGAALPVDLTTEDASDRVRVIYVPTPADVAEAMVKLAGVGPTDIVFEPGCGDARITIAAVKGGARRGVGIDIDPARVEESQARVNEAGLEDRIEIRLGDALDIRDLSTATVVFLYMGDHFNSLIRPILWKSLPVGARVVSHRFTMGDWTPDSTLSMTSDEGGGEYELHLWTITETIKRRLNEPPEHK